ncbi:MAG: T9SS type A sorting domain-containing protein [Prevotellaceae bacterium]|jgi:hypothetical protein|nr:T9SS type A sorting domain-containing protein [Prevotellaceae bacterium]
MKKIYTLALSLFAAANIFAQSVTYDCNALRAGDVRNLKQMEYQDPGKGGTGLIWDFSQSKELKEGMTLRQAENRAVTNNKNLNLICDEGGVKNTLFEISKTQKMYWGLENSSVKIRFNEPIVDLKFPFYYGEKVEGIMDGVYSYLNSGKEESIKGTYTTQADATGTLLLPDGNVYKNVLRVKVEKKYNQTFQNIGGSNEEYQISSIRYQYFAEGVRYPVLIVLETEIKTDCKCACSNKTKEAYYETPALQFGESGKEIISEKGNTLIENFEYSVSPNPFENDLRIALSLRKNAKVEIDLVDMSGKTVKQIVSGKLEKSDYVYNASASDIAAGNYIIRLKIDKEVYSNKLVKK